MKDQRMNRDRINPEVDQFILALDRWSSIVRKLREICLRSGLDEEYKWKQPCYSSEGKIIVMIGVLKDYCCLSFFKGALLDDPKHILIQQGENSRSGRIVKFTEETEVDTLQETLLFYIKAAILLEKTGQKVEKATISLEDYPEELIEVMAADTDFAEAFEGLTPGRRRAYVMHFHAARQSPTRQTRIEKYKDRILKGKGMHDCICGLSRRMPNCDGSHKQIESN